MSVKQSKSGFGYGIDAAHDIVLVALVICGLLMVGAFGVIGFHAAGLGVSWLWSATPVRMALLALAYIVLKP